VYEVFDHTADLGLRIRASTLQELFALAARGLFSIIVENLDDVRPAESARFSIDGREHDYLLFDWLAELLYAFETKRLLLVEFDVRLTDTGLQATARGEPADPTRHRLDHEIKAITYHGLHVEQTSDGWQAEVIVDI
jgi:SHS2 domain-containing protein